MSLGTGQERFQGNSTFCSDLLESSHALQPLQSCSGVVQRVATAQLLSKCILDTCKLQHDTHSTTSNHASTLRGWAKHDLCGSKDAIEAVGERRILRQRNADQIALCVNNGLLHGLHNILGRFASNAHSAIFISNNDLKEFQQDTRHKNDVGELRR